MTPEKKKTLMHSINDWATWAVRGLIVFFSFQIWSSIQDTKVQKVVIDYHTQQIVKIQDEQKEIRKDLENTKIKVYQLTTSSRNTN